MNKDEKVVVENVVEVHKHLKNKKCKCCEEKTRWLSVDGMCWNCTVQFVKDRACVQNDSWLLDKGDMADKKKAKDYGLRLKRK